MIVMFVKEMNILHLLEIMYKVDLALVLLLALYRKGLSLRKNKINKMMSEINM